MDSSSGGYEVESILATDGTGDAHMYLCKWKGWDDPADNTWEYANTLEFCADLVRAFEQTQAEASADAAEQQNKAISREDAESNARLVEALMGGVEEAAEAMEKSQDVPSHMQLDRDENGEPIQLRFVYVDESSCIGCTYCAQVARNTFYMNEEAGRARAFAQGQDEPETILEAIDTCPVNCISFVDHSDLVILETEREGQMINPASIGVPATWSVSMNSLPPTKAKLGGSASLVCCNNCPGRGCKECPMYGVGQNPVYLARLEEREAKKEASGEAARERADEAAAEKVDAIFEVEPVLVVEPMASGASADDDEFGDLVGMVVPTGLSADDEAGLAASEEPNSDFFALLHSYGDDDDLLD